MAPRRPTARSNNRRCRGESSSAPNASANRSDKIATRFYPGLTNYEKCGILTSGGIGQQARILPSIIAGVRTMPSVRKITRLPVMDSAPAGAGKHLPLILTVNGGSSSIKFAVYPARAKKPDDRPQSVSELRAILDSCTGVIPWTERDANHWWALHRPETARKTP